MKGGRIEEKSKGLIGGLKGERTEETTEGGNDWRALEREKCIEGREIGRKKRRKGDRKEGALP